MGSYEELLNRARKNLPAQTLETSRFAVPKLDSFIQGPETIIRNFTEVSKALGREPVHLLKFLQIETGVRGKIDDSRAVLKGQKNQEFLNEKLELYVKEFVLCSQCKKPDTEIRKVTGVEQVKCKACGAKYTIRKI